MNPIEDYQDVLQNIEFAIVGVWRRHSEANNYTVMRAYEAAIAHYNALAREQIPKPAGLKGLDDEVFYCGGASTMRRVYSEELALS